jgi:cytochrome b pre-mRNA-processing protein 3
LPDWGFDGKSMILNRLFKSQEKPERRLYAAIVAAARHVTFYRDMGVADTVDGRFEMIVLHLFLVLSRLKHEGVEGLRQDLTDEFFGDMDGSLREMGVSDVTVGKKVRKLAESYYGRVMAYDKAFVSRELLEEAIRRNVYPDGAIADCVRALADYVLAAKEALATLPVETVKRGGLKFR